MRNVYSLFETHGVRIMEPDCLDERLSAMTFYSAARRDFTMFLTRAFDNKPHRKEFLFLTEIGRMFLFASHDAMAFRNTDKSRRFAHHFAATFLLPASAVRTAVYSLRIRPEDWTYELLLRLKARFGVPSQAFNIRLKELGLITGAKHREFEQRIVTFYTETGYQEPEPSNDLPQNRLGDIVARRRL